ncbi:cupin domain-containing protein [Streptomyces sp. NPDC090075]|uniref:cupin domain-containing protein n=1 Tax=Streptomyces sp. NPDC090075 TaxID=3365937 RepID=UPI0037FF7824
MSVSTGLRHVSLDTLNWKRIDVHGTVMDKATIFEGAYEVRSAFFRMAEGQVIENHTHTKWVQVAVLQGSMLVQQDGSEDLEAQAGSAYFLDPHHPHVETALTETVLLVTQGEDRPGW